MAIQREPAKRVFAQEFRDSDLTFKEGDDQYAPQYLLTPTGAKCNRIFVVGTLIEKEDVGKENEYWRGRISDPTGSFFVYAGQYQPEAAKVLSDIEPPEFVAVVGKVSTFESDGGVLTSIRPESIQVVDSATRDQWVIDAARATLERIEAIDESEDGKRAREHYETNPSTYRDIILDALRSVKDYEIQKIDLSAP